jgi:hypothetical protein
MPATPDRIRAFNLKEHPLYGIYIVRTWLCANNMGIPATIYPWRYSIQKGNGEEQFFSGIPNYCESRGQALKRAWAKVNKMERDSYANQ